MSYLFPLNNRAHGSNPDVLDKENGQGNIIAEAWRNDNVSSFKISTHSAATTILMRHDLFEKSSRNILILKGAVVA